MVSIKSSLILLASCISAWTPIPSTAPIPYPDLSSSTKPYTPPSPTSTSSSNCPISTDLPIFILNQANITSSTIIKTGEDFMITWSSPTPNWQLNNTESRLELWAANGGPVNSPVVNWKAPRLFNQYNYTVNFPTDKVNATTKGGAIIWKLFVAVYSTHYDHDVAQREPWNLPYYDVKTVEFI